MQRFVPIEDLFKGRHFDRQIIGFVPELVYKLRQRVSARLLRQFHQHLLELQSQVLPKSPSGAAVRYALISGRR